MEDNQTNPLNISQNYVIICAKIPSIHFSAAEHRRNVLGQTKGEFCRTRTSLIEMCLFLILHVICTGEVILSPSTFNKSKLGEGLLKASKTCLYIFIPIIFMSCLMFSFISNCTVSSVSCAHFPCGKVYKAILTLIDLSLRPASKPQREVGYRMMIFSSG